VLREVIDQVDTSTQIVYILCAIILVMNILVISVITVLNLMDSKKEIALMRMIGISMRRIRQVYLIQNGIMGLISTLLSLLLCHLSLGFINSLTSAMGIVMNPYKFYTAELAIALIVFVISVLPTLICIWFMSRRDALSQ
ncbi:MAG: FtsX-like permease family protein, partial [Clostridia bacterium]|nr:FtsX-like permease family protein [Clostridia bacterium]